MENKGEKILSEETKKSQRNKRNKEGDGLTPISIPLSMECLYLGPRRTLLESPGWMVSMLSPPSPLKSRLDKRDKERRGTKEETS